MQRLSFLNRLRASGFPDAVVAGGFCRDFIHQREIKDIDVFLEWKPGYTLNQLDEAMDGRTRRVVVSAAAPRYIFGMDPDVMQVLEYGFASGSDAAEYLDGTTAPDVNGVVTYDNEPHPIQVICLTRPFTFDRFDFGLCQAMFDGSALSYTGAFQADLKARTFTLTRSDNQAQFDRSMVRYERLRQKYPDHRLIISPQYEGFATYWQAGQVGFDDDFNAVDTTPDWFPHTVRGNPPDRVLP